MAGSGKAIDDLVDLLAITQEKVYPFRDDDFVMTTPDFPVLNDWFSERKKDIQSGSNIIQPITLKANRNTTLRNLYEPIAIGSDEERVQLSWGWSIANFHFMFEDREKLINRRGSEIRDIYRSRRRDAYYGWAEDLEAFGFGVPNNASDGKTPHGLRAHIVPANSGVAAGTKGFLGRRLIYADGTNTEVIGNQSRATYDKLRNYAYVYDGDIDAQWVRTVMRRTFHDTTFKAPRRTPAVQATMPQLSTTMYCGLDTYESLENLVDSQTGARNSLDLTALDGDPMFKKVRFERAPQLDDVTHQPIIGVDHRHFKAVAMEGEWMNEQRPMRGGVERHRTVVIHVDSMFGFVCKNPRHAGFYLHRPIT